MNNKLLLVIDVQQAFINKYTNHIPKLIEEHINNNIYNTIVLGKFVNNLDSKFVKELSWLKCIDDKDAKLVLENCEKFPIIERTAYSLYNNKLDLILKKNKIDTIYLCGLDTDACILKTAVDLFENNYNVKILENLCASSAGIEHHNEGINLLKRFIGKNNII